MQKLTSSIYGFETLIERGYLYVDKTEYLWKLVQNYGESYFLSRPRRFGKSLTVSTLKAIFEGKRELFKGLAISKVDYDWKKYPVLHLDMGNCMAKTAGELKLFLAKMLEIQASEHNVKLGKVDADLIPSFFEDLILKLSEMNDVVILIDEYDKPILGNIGTPEADAVLDVLKGFYSTIKKCNDKERFVFITGVSKFSHVSLFSDLNNLTDLTMNWNFATMLGYTQEELENFFSEYIDRACQQTGMTREKLLPKIKRWYDGFRFHANAESIYNPVSLAKFFENHAEFSNYWFDTGTPSFLLDLIKKTNYDFEKALTRPMNKFAFQKYEVSKADPLPLLLQTGYLTIKSSFEELGQQFYHLGFPNYEVEEAFNAYLLNAYTAIDKEISAMYLVEMVQNLRSGNVEEFMDCARTYFANIPYDIQKKMDYECNYQLVFFLLFQSMPGVVTAEARTNSGRIDAVAEVEEYVYIFEFKIDRSAEIALDQIREKKYYQKYRHSGKKIVLIGANFDTKEHQLTDWEIEKLY